MLFVITWFIQKRDCGRSLRDWQIIVVDPNSWFRAVTPWPAGGGILDILGNLTGNGG